MRALGVMNRSLYSLSASTHPEWHDVGFFSLLVHWIFKEPWVCTTWLSKAVPQDIIHIQKDGFQGGWVHPSSTTSLPMQLMNNAAQFRPQIKLLMLVTLLLTRMVWGHSCSLSVAASTRKSTTTGLLHRTVLLRPTRADLDDMLPTLQHFGPRSCTSSKLSCVASGANSISFWHHPQRSFLPFRWTWPIYFSLTFVMSYLLALNPNVDKGLRLH